MSLRTYCRSWQQREGSVVFHYLEAWHNRLLTHLLNRDDSFRFVWIDSPGALTSGMARTVIQDDSVTNARVQTYNRIANPVVVLFIRTHSLQVPYCSLLSNALTTQKTALCTLSLLVMYSCSEELATLATFKNIDLFACFSTKISH